MLQFGPEVWGDFYLTNESDFSKALRPIWQVISQQLNQNPPASVSPMVLAEMLKGYSVVLDGSFEVYPYLEGLRLRFVQKSDAPGLARELKRVSVRRDLIKKTEETKRELVTRPNATFEEMTGIVEKGITSVSTDYYRSSEFTNVFENIIEVTEKRGENPVDASQLGYIGPFPIANKTCGAWTAQGLMVTVGARTGNMKSAFGFFYNLFLAEKYHIPILLLDVGEMSLERIQRRALCCMSEGRIPLWAIASGEWRNNKEWTHIVRYEIWPRIKGLRIDYINVGNMSPHEKIALIRRYYYNKVGRGNPLGILDDYLKGVEALGKNSSEYQSVGYYVNDIKSLITNEINAWFWTSVQNNRMGVYRGKKASEIADTEDQMGVSDRIIQQSDWGFIMRFKVTEEIATEKNLFGNIKLTPVKTREMLGKEYEKALRPVKMPNGRFVDNYFSLDTRSFYFTEKGDLHQMLSILGQNSNAIGSTSSANAIDTHTL